MHNLLPTTSNSFILRIGVNLVFSFIVITLIVSLSTIISLMAIFSYFYAFTIYLQVHLFLRKAYP